MEERFGRYYPDMEALRGAVLGSSARQRAMLARKLGRRDREHLLGCRGQRLSEGGRLRRREARRDRADQGGGPRLRAGEHPRQRRVPGIIDTRMMDRVTGDTPEGRQRVISQEPIGTMGHPEEIAAAVLWLCSEAASFVVGHAMVVDGGQTV